MARKNNRRFDYPEDLDLRPFALVDSSKQDPENRAKQAEAGRWAYSLRGIIIHSGHASQGHFWTFLRVERDWFCFDDTRVTRWKRDEVLAFSKGRRPNHATSNAYCLFYTRGASAGPVTARRLETQIPKSPGPAPRPRQASRGCAHWPRTGLRVTPRQRDRPILRAGPGAVPDGPRKCLLEEDGPADRNRPAAPDRNPRRLPQRSDRPG